MFVGRSSRLVASLWAGADLALEFVTLGEYRLPEPVGTRSARSPGAGVGGAAAPGGATGCFPRTEACSAVATTRPARVATTRPTAGRLTPAAARTRS